MGGNEPSLRPIRQDFVNIGGWGGGPFGFVLYRCGGVCPGGLGSKLVSLASQVRFL